MANKPPPAQLEASYTHVKRFAAGSDESLAFLDENGFVVIAHALTSPEAEHAAGLTWDYLEGLDTGIDRADPTTWTDDRWPVAVHGGIIPSQGIGQSEAQWFIRSVANVKRAFAAIWDDDDLLVSFDGMALWRPPHVEPSWLTNRGGSWLHIDQHKITILRQTLLSDLIEEQVLHEHERHDKKRAQTQGDHHGQGLIVRPMEI